MIFLLTLAVQFLFNIDKVNMILDEMVQNGFVVESNKDRVLALLRVAESANTQTSRPWRSTETIREHWRWADEIKSGGPEDELSRYERSWRYIEKQTYKSHSTDDEEVLTLNGGRQSTGMHEDIDSFLTGTKNKCFSVCWWFHGSEH